MNSNKQALLIDVLLGTPDLFALVTPIVEARYFDPEFRPLMTFVLDYQQQFKGIPSPSVIKAETGIDVNPQPAIGDVFDYACNEYENFCKRKAIDYAIRDSVSLIEKGDYGSVEQMIREAVTTSLTRNLGTDFFDNPAALMERIETETGVPISTGYIALDNAIGGGVYRKDLIIVSANSGGGKSIMMDNLAANWHNMGLWGVYFSFELSEEMLAKRHLSMVTEVDAPQLFMRKQEVIAKTEEIGQTAGKFLYVRMPVGTKPSSIRAYLKEYQLKYGRVPDFMMFDYMGLMAADVHVQTGDVYTRDKLVSEALREIGNDYNAIVVTASQQNRSAVGEVDIDHSHIAGGISKIDTCDLAMSIIFTDSMKAAGEFALQLIKTRSSDGVGKNVNLKWVGKHLRIKDPDNLADAVSYKHQNQKSKPIVDGKPTKKEGTRQASIPSALADLINTD